MSMFRYEEQRQIKVEVVEKSPEAPQKSQEAGQKSDSGDKSIVKITKASADDKPVCPGLVVSSVSRTPSVIPELNLCLEVISLNVFFLACVKTYM